MNTKTWSDRSLNMDSAEASRDEPDRHSTWTIFFHWSSVLAIVIATVAILWRNAIDDDGLRVVLLDVHRQAGLFVLLALVLRVATRAVLGMKSFSAASSSLVKLAAAAAHVALYGALLVLPLTGLATSQAHAVTVKLFGLAPLPIMVADDPDLADVLSDWHEWLAWGLLALVIAHVAAALWHHFSQKDKVLHAMLPAIKRRTTASLPGPR